MCLDVILSTCTRAEIAGSALSKHMQVNCELWIVNRIFHRFITLKDTIIIHQFFRNVLRWCCELQGPTIKIYLTHINSSCSLLYVRYNEIYNSRNKRRNKFYIRLKYYSPMPLGLHLAFSSRSNLKLEMYGSLVTSVCLFNCIILSFGLYYLV